MTKLPNQAQKLLNAIAFEKKKKREEVRLVLNPDVKPPKVFTHAH